MKKRSCELRMMSEEQSEKKHIRKIISVWSVAALLTLLVLVGNYLGNGKTNAKYVSSVSGTDKARVACFVSDLTSLTAKDDVLLSPNVSDWVECYTFTVKNEKSGKTSEVTMDYELLIDISGPAGVIYNISSTDADTCSSAPTLGNQITATGGVFRAGVAANHTYVIKAKWDNPSNVSYQNASIPISVNVTADVTQRD